MFGTNGEKSIQIEPDLSDANLSETQLVLLVGGDVIGIDLSGANLSGAVLWGADLLAANLNKANLSKANLTRSQLIGTDLDKANLSGATLNLAIFDGVHLNGTNFGQAIISSTIFVSTDLSLAIGLETAHPDSPSSIGIDTIYLSQGNISEVFLIGAGVPDSFITYIRSLVGKPIEYYSCFISHSSKDEAFARRLYADLQSHNVRCWFAPEDLKIGAKIRYGIDEAIRLHDKLLLIFSKPSVASGWVEHEVKAALAKEHKEKRVVLFPVRVDNAVLESPFSWATEIRQERNIGDFTRWKQHDGYQKAFNRLLRDLKAE
jgi:hypothetical protein